ncbi:MAG: NAD(P)H-dependent flavin oxidoreductase [Reyranella sp.]|uniref:NAD(P)H-dependent flavin oxidoreductase n=1 Tax=Reyranella sp. TaxID=1929291 RepID=UPI003D0DD667
MPLPASLSSRLRLPLIAAPMFLVSGPALVKAACRGGVIGSFPTANCRTSEELEAWLGDLRDDLARAADATGRAPAPFCPNLIVHRSNPRLADDLAAVLRHRAEIVITSVGSPEPVLKPLKDAGCLVLADVASVRHAEKAVAAGVDGLVLLTAGAGGQTGWANPFAFARAVRAFWKGIVIMAGGMADGHAVAAAEALGCDLAYMGTKFIATRESMAKDAYKAMLVQSRLDDVLLTRAFTGLETNMLRPSIEAAGLDPANLPSRGGIDIAKDINAAEREKSNARRWKDIWSAGHSVSGVSEISSAAELIERTAAEYAAARHSMQHVKA